MPLSHTFPSYSYTFYPLKQFSSSFPYNSFSYASIPIYPHLILFHPVTVLSFSFPNTPFSYASIPIYSSLVLFHPVIKFLVPFLSVRSSFLRCTVRTGTRFLYFSVHPSSFYETPTNMLIPSNLPFSTLPSIPL
jgi:hypothetical protein